MTGLPILSILIFLPALAAVVVSVLHKDEVVRWLTFLALLADFGIAAGTQPACQFGTELQLE